jgi:2-keto-3-deoxy-L-rhamnonate aldolase RhmA
MSTDRSLKQRIRDREILVALRVGVTMDRSEIERALEQKPYDLLYVEGQHSPFTEDQLVTFCRMAEEIDIPVKLRIPHVQHTYLIGRYFDFGPLAILVPEVEEEASVEEAIKYTNYLPDGKRSFGGPFRYGVASGKAPAERKQYAGWWSDQAVLGIMLESIEAISNARRFIKPGLDFIAFGTSDMGLSLETNPDFPIRNTDDCMRYVADQVRDQVALGMAIPTKPEEREEYLEMGITIFQESLVPR